jgi:hypothetical protein
MGRGFSMKSAFVNLSRLGILVAALLSFAPEAYANTDWSFNALGLDATIVVSGNPDGPGFQILSITGNVAGYGSIDSLIANVGSDPGGQTTTIGVGGGTNFTFDDLFYTTGNDGMHLDGNGLVFKLSDGQYADLWENSPGNYELFIGNYLSDVSGNAEFSVPEAPSILLLLTGLAAMTGLFLFRRRKTESAAFAAG